MFESRGMATQIFYPWAHDQNSSLKHKYHKKMANVKDVIYLCIIGEGEFIERTTLPLCPCLHLEQDVMMSVVGCA